jgi:hypothetical protein
VRLQVITSYTDLVVLVNDIKAADIDSFAVTSSILMNYRRSSRRANVSLECGSADFSEVTESVNENLVVQDNESSVADAHKFSSCNLADYKHTGGVAMAAKKLNVAQVKAFVVSQLFSGDNSLFDEVVASATKLLASVQMYLNFLHSRQVSRQVTAVVQPIFILLLKWLLAQLKSAQPTMLVTAAQVQCDLKVNITDKDFVEHEFVGQTDVIVSEGQVDFGETTENVNSIFELKYPFGSLYRKTSMREKDQLVLEEMGIRAGQKFKGLVKGCLTDLMTIIPIFQLPFRRSFIMFKSTSDLESYVVVVLLMLCSNAALPESILNSFVKGGELDGVNDEVDLAEGEGGDEEGGDEDNADEDEDDIADNNRNSRVRGKRKQQGSSEKQRKCPNLGRNNRSRNNRGHAVNGRSGLRTHAIKPMDDDKAML